MTVDQAARRGYEPGYKIRLREFTDRHYDDLTYWPWLITAVLIIAIVAGAL